MNVKPTLCTENLKEEFSMLQTLHYPSYYRERVHEFVFRLVNDCLYLIDIALDNYNWGAVGELMVVLEEAKVTLNEVASDKEETVKELNRRINALVPTILELKEKFEQNHSVLMKLVTKYESKNNED